MYWVLLLTYKIQQYYFEPVILTGFYTSLEIKTQLNASNLDNIVNSSCEYSSAKHDVNN